MERPLDVTLIALIFVLSHFLAPYAFRFRERFRRAATSFTGGLAASYICLQLLPEIDEGSDLLGGRIYFLVLVGLSIYYGLEVWISRHGGGRQQFSLRLLILAIYTLSISFTLSTQLPRNIVLSLIYAVAMGLHIMSNDFALLEDRPARFLSPGRYVLIGAVLLGYVMSVVRSPNPVVLDAGTAMLAGFMIFTVFRKEIPDFSKAHFRAFLSGSAVFLIVHIFLDRDLPLLDALLF